MRRVTTPKESAVKTAAKTLAALGLRAHSGWAALVVVAGPPNEPVVLDRRRIVIADPAIAGSKQPYHAAEGWPLSKAAAYLERCTRSTRLLARRAIRAAFEDVLARGQSVAGCGILVASGRPVPTLQQALSSHAMLHTAEGELFRNALIEASEKCSIPITRVKEKELFERGAQDLGTPVPELQRRVTELGRPLGPPWSQDEKWAALVGWMVLAAVVRRRARPSKRTK